jgi:hypothetical protein
MDTSISALGQNVTAQAVQIPEMYGQVDFSITPERFTTASGDQTELEPEFANRRAELLANEEVVALVKAHTMIGDSIADAYAALIPQHGFRKLITMLQEACVHGLEKVPHAPPELVRLIQSMERFPAWLDIELIEQGARIERNGYAHRAPYVIRGGFIGTYMNKYSALPMALTGALSNKTAAHRVHETATFFTTTVMPGALDRFGAGFKAAAMVRLMHSMVRFNILHGKLRWEVRTHGIPIPQVDQLPAGMMSVYPLALEALRQGRTEFNAEERARAELARYRCFLLGLPEELLADTPQGVVDVLLTRHATLRSGFDETCAGLVRATMNADLSSDRSLIGRVDSWLEHGVAKVFFVKRILHGDREAAEKIGVPVAWTDYIAAVLTGVVVTIKMAPYALAARVPGLSGMADRALIRKLTSLLASYGHAEFATSAATYRPSHT